MGKVKTNLEFFPKEYTIIVSKCRRIDIVCNGVKRNNIKKNSRIKNEINNPEKNFQEELQRKSKKLFRMEEP